MTTIEINAKPTILVIPPNLPLTVNSHSKIEDNVPAINHVKVEDKVKELFNANQLKRFQQVSDDHFLSKRFIVHLLGDSFMQNTSYEGWFQSDALLHMIAILNKNQISPEVTKVLNDLKKCLEWHSKTLAEIALKDDNDIDDEKEQNHPIIDTSDEINGVEVNEDISKITNEISEIEVKEVIVEYKLSPLMIELKEAIENLAIGEKAVFSGGSLYHAVIYEAKRVGQEEFEFCVYNTGSGTSRHWLIFEDTGNLKVQGVYRLTGVTKDKLLSPKFLCQLHELQHTEIKDFGKALYDDILSLLEGKRGDVPTDAIEYMRIQRSGTCTWKMLNAYLRYNLPLIEYKFLKLKARLDIFQKWFDLEHSLDCASLSQSVLNRFIVNRQFDNQVSNSHFEFSREDILLLGIYKVQKTFNKYHFLLSQEDIKKCETWYTKFTGQSIYSQQTKV